MQTVHILKFVDNDKLILLYNKNPKITFIQQKSNIVVTPEKLT